MKIYNKEKTQELQNPNLELGYLIEDKRLVKHNEEVEEKVVYIKQVHYNKDGSIKGVTKRVDEENTIKGQPAFDDYEDIQVYIPYTTEELKTKQINKLKSQLTELNFDLLQDQAGLIVPNLDEKKQQFVNLHNELRTLLDKPLREVK